MDSSFAVTLVSILQKQTAACVCQPSQLRCRYCKELCEAVERDVTKELVRFAVVVHVRWRWGLAKKHLVSARKSIQVREHTATKQVSAVTQRSRHIANTCGRRAGLRRKGIVHSAENAPAAQTPGTATRI